MRNVILSDSEVMVYDFFFAGILSMRCHPGTTRDAAPNWTMDEMADLALEAVEKRREVMGVNGV